MLRIEETTPMSGSYANMHERCPYDKFVFVSGFIAFSDKSGIKRTATRGFPRQNPKAGL
jgi:hypothetical protein